MLQDVLADRRIVPVGHVVAAQVGDVLFIHACDYRVYNGHSHSPFFPGFTLIVYLYFIF